MLQDLMQLAHRPHVRAENRKLARIHEAQVNADLRSGGRSTGDKSSARLERAQAFVPRGGADMLQNDVHTLLAGDLTNFFRNLLLVVIDNVVGAQLARLFCLHVVSSGGNDSALKKLPYLNSSDT